MGRIVPIGLHKKYTSLLYRLHDNFASLLVITPCQPYELCVYMCLSHSLSRDESVLTRHATIPIVDTRLLSQLGFWSLVCKCWRVFVHLALEPSHHPPSGPTRA